MSVPLKGKLSYLFAWVKNDQRLYSTVLEKKITVTADDDLPQRTLPATLSSWIMAKRETPRGKYGIYTCTARDVPGRPELNTYEETPYVGNRKGLEPKQHWSRLKAAKIVQALQGARMLDTSWKTAVRQPFGALAETIPLAGPRLSYLSAAFSMDEKRYYSKVYASDTTVGEKHTPARQLNWTMAVSVGDADEGKYQLYNCHYIRCAADKSQNGYHQQKVLGPMTAAQAIEEMTAAQLKAGQLGHQPVRFQPFRLSGLPKTARINPNVLSGGSTR